MVKKAQLYGTLVKFLLILVIGAGIILFGINSIVKIKNISANTELLLFKNKIKTSIIIYASESASVHGEYKVPFAYQVTSNNIINLKDFSILTMKAN